MINKISIFVCLFFANNSVYSMDSNKQSLQLDLCMLIPRKDLSNEQLISQANLLIQNGADPNYINPKSGKNYLMLAVQNNNRALVNFFMRHEPDYNLCDKNGYNARNFNVVCKDLKNMENVLIRYVKRCREIETNRVVFPSDKEDYEDETFILDEVDIRYFFEALRIDRMLEMKQVQCKSPLHRWLFKNALLRNAVRYAFARFCADWDKRKSFTSDIYTILYEKTSKRHSL